MSGRVFVIQKPLKRDKDSGKIVPKMDLAPAAEFGELVYLFNWTDLKNVRTTDFTKVYQILLEKLSTYDPEHDYILPVGHPVAMSMSVLAAIEAQDSHIPVIRWLYWDRSQHEYVVVVLHP